MGLDSATAGLPGSAGGRTISELQEEVEALKHFFTDEDASTQITVDYMYELVPRPATFAPLDSFCSEAE